MPLDPPSPSAPDFPAALLSRNPLRWLRVFGPGAILASLTIGTGELIFSSRAGALFGYRILWIFLLTLVLKWVLVYGAARHMILSGAHPLERWTALPGPRGWLPLLLLLLALAAFPIWVGFHSMVQGDLLRFTLERAGGPALNRHLGAGIILAAALGIVAFESYKVFERVQLWIVISLIACALVSLILYHPDWLALLEGLLVPRPVSYPEWALNAAADLRGRPVLLEAVTCASVIGGASYDYLSYVSFLRESGWGMAGRGRPLTSDELEEVARDPLHPARRWIRALAVDSGASFLLVLLFSAVFVTCGAAILGPQGKIPDEKNMLGLQAELVTRLHPWLLPLYIAGAFLALFGTLYGTIEVGVSLARESAAALFGKPAGAPAPRLRTAAILWSGCGGAAVIAWSAYQHRAAASGSAPTLISILTPAALFTGALSCGLVPALNTWADRRFLPPPLRMGRPLEILSWIAAAAFAGAGLASYWAVGIERSGGKEIGGWIALGSIALTAIVGLAAGWAFSAWRGRVGRRPDLQ